MTKKLIEKIEKIPKYKCYVGRHLESNQIKDASVIIERAVNGWLSILKLHEAREHANALLREFRQSPNPRLPTFLRGERKISLASVGLPYKAVKDDNMRTSEWIFYLQPKQLTYIALGIAAASYASYRLYQTYAREKNGRIEEPATVVPQKVEHTVIFAIEAKEETLLQWFKAKDYGAIQAADILYNAIKYLWYGKSDNLQDTRLSIFMKQDEETQEDDVYDVYLVKCTLRRDVPGFKGAASAMDRMDAFEQFFTEITDCEISNRVSYRVYDTELYKTR